MAALRIITDGGDPGKTPRFEHVVVVGGGIAGQAVVEQLRDRDSDVAITLLCGEDRLPYDRVSLSRILADSEDPAVLQLRPEAWYADRRVDVRLNAWVQTLDPDAGTLTLAHTGETLTYDRVVLCTGSDALVPPIPGASTSGVEVFRGPEDCQKIATAVTADDAQRAVVIGGGLLGLEAAYGIAKLGCPVTVVHLMGRLMERQLDAGAAALLAPAIEGLGVEVVLEASTASIDAGPDGRVSGLTFADGTTLDADLVVVAVGIKPQADLARATGLAVERGIVVDDQLVTSHERVLAVGECAQHRGVCHGIVAPIHEQAAVAADTLSGARSRYLGSIPAAKLKVMGVDLVTAGAAEGEREVLVADAGTYRKLVIDAEDRVIGTVLLGDTKGAELLLDAVKTGLAAPDPLALLAAASQATAAELPDTAQICNCNGVGKGDILSAISDGALGSTQEVVAVTRAGAGCGSCKPLVTELLAHVRGGAVQEATYLCPCRKLTRADVAAQVRDSDLQSVSDVAAACGAGRDCGACKPGLAYLVSEIRGNQHREERHARFINDRVHANIQNDGTFSVVPRMRGGVTTPAELRRIADVADKYDIPTVKVTGGQRIDLLGIKKEDLPAVWEELDMPSGHAYAKSVRTVKTCVGTTHCRFGLGDAMGVGIAFETAMEGLYTPAKVKAAVTGCPRNCAEAYVKDIGLVAIGTPTQPAWEIYVGGAAGASVRKGDLLATLSTSDEAQRVALAFLQYYRENADYLERSYTFMERVGLEAVQAQVLDPAKQDEYYERYRIAKAAADPDPWRERHAPVNPKQFAELDTEPALAPVGPPIGGGR